MRTHTYHQTLHHFTVAMPLREQPKWVNGSTIKSKSTALITWVASQRREAWMEQQSKLFKNLSSLWASQALHFRVSSDWMTARYIWGLHSLGGDYYCLFVFALLTNIYIHFWVTCMWSSSVEFMPTFELRYAPDWDNLVMSDSISAKLLLSKVPSFP